jgi:hypothetical protein
MTDLALWQKQLRLKGQFRGAKPRGERISFRVGDAQFQSVTFDWLMRSTASGGALDLAFFDATALDIHIALVRWSKSGISGESESGPFSMDVDRIVDLFSVAGDVAVLVSRLLEEGGFSFESTVEGGRTYFDLSLGAQLWLIERLERIERRR